MCIRDSNNPLNEYSIVIVEFEVEFADAETQLSYCRSLCGRPKVNGINKNDIAANTTFKIGEKRDLNRRILYGEDFHSIIYWITFYIKKLINHYEFASC